MVIGSLGGNMSEILENLLERIAKATEEQNEIQRGVYNDYERRYQEGLKRREQDLIRLKEQYDEQTKINEKFYLDVTEIKGMHKQMVEIQNQVMEIQKQLAERLPK